MGCSWLKFLGATGKVDSQLKGITGLLDQKVEGQLLLAGHVLDKNFNRFLAPDGSFPITLGGTVDKPRPQIKLELKNLIPAKGLLEGLFGK